MMTPTRSRLVLGRRRMLHALTGGLISMAAMQAAAQPARDPLSGRFGGPFSLIDHTGRRVSDTDYRGRYMLVYFGFTRCTDTCPVDMPMIVAAMDRLGSRAAVLQPLFITVDPEDTAAKLKDYVTAFHPRLIGLTGSEEELSAVARAYRVHRRKLLLPGEVVTPPQQHTRHPHSDHRHAQHGARFTIDHGSLTYLMGPDGAFLTLLPHNTGIDRRVDVLGRYLPAG
ncbi:Copper chaperone SCO1/SenC [Rhabdaerophilaceae bacterium]